MKAILLAVIISATSLYAAPSYYCALGLSTPTELSQKGFLPYALMHTDELAYNRIQLTIVSNYESIKSEVIIASKLATTEKSVSYSIDGKETDIILNFGEKTSIVVGNARFTCEEL